MIDYLYLIIKIEKLLIIKAGLSNCCKREPIKKIKNHSNQELILIKTWTDIWRLFLAPGSSPQRLSKLFLGFKIGQLSWGVCTKQNRIFLFFFKGKWEVIKIFLHWKYHFGGGGADTMIARAIFGPRASSLTRELKEIQNCRASSPENKTAW